MFMPVLVYSENEAVINNSKKIAQRGHNALIVTGRSSASRNGSLNDVVHALEKERISYSVYNKIEENPTVQNVMEAVGFGQEKNSDFVIGIGGGSALDAAKAVSFMLAHPGEKEDLLYTHCDDSALPLVLIPTTCGTGAEVTGVSVLTVSQLHTKKSISHKIFADLALIDGKYLKDIPIHILRNTALDALTHLTESYINSNTDVFSRMFADAGLDLWRKNMDCLVTGKPDDVQMSEMMNASALGGMAIAQNGTGIPHGLSYSLTYKLNIPHGKAVGYFTAGYLSEASEKDRNHILEKLGFDGVGEFSDWYKELYGITEVEDSILEQAVDELWKNQPKVKTAPFEVSYDKLMKIAFYNKNN